MVLRLSILLLICVFAAVNLEAAERALSFDPSSFDHEETEQMTFEETVLRRRSQRAYTVETVTFDELSRLLFFTYGITGDGPQRELFRAAPSAGACHPIDLFIAVQNIDGLADGVYMYDAAQNSVRTHRKGSFQAALAKACYDQAFIAESQVVIACVARWSRTLTRYGQRGYRYVYLDAGHIIQNAYLEATYLGLRPCAVGAFDDVGINTIFDVDGKEQTVIYMMAIGA